MKPPSCFHPRLCCIPEDERQEVEDLPPGFTFADAQESFGGPYVEVVRVPIDPSVVLLVHEEGLLRKMKPNPRASMLAARAIVGPAFVVPVRWLE